MKTPLVNCKVEAFCSIKPSESKEKVSKAISYVLSNSQITRDKNSIQATSENLESLDKIFETINSRKSQNVYRRQLRNNQNDNSTWFYLNKQAAFVEKIALCSEAEESPLGPIKIIIKSKNIEKITDWLVGGI